MKQSTRREALQKTLALGLGTGLGTSLSSRALAQGAAWPSRPIRLIVPFGPGGFTDVVARILGQRCV